MTYKAKNKTTTLFWSYLSFVLILRCTCTDWIELLSCWIYNYVVEENATTTNTTFLLLLRTCFGHLKTRYRDGMWIEVKYDKGGGGVELGGVKAK